MRGGLSKFDDLELQFKDIAASGAALDEVWKAVDVNGNGALSLAEITKVCVIIAFPSTCFSQHAPVCGEQLPALEPRPCSSARL